VVIFVAMNLHEYQGKQLLEKFNVSIQRGYVANNPERLLIAQKNFQMKQEQKFLLLKLKFMQVEEARVEE